MRDLIDLRLKDWKKVGRTLGFPESALNEIETCSNERDQYNSKKIKLFKEWKVKYARKPMNRTIVQALIDAGEHEAAHIFCQKHGMYNNYNIVIIIIIIAKIKLYIYTGTSE